MGTATFTSNGTWTWPDDINKAVVRCFGGGAGGASFGVGHGGGGGACIEATVYKSGAELNVVVGASVGRGANGNPSLVTLPDSTVVCQALGGTSGESTGAGGGNGGDGGLSQFGRGGGGGSSASYRGDVVGSDGQDAASPSHPTYTGAGGIAPPGGGNGGNGGTTGQDGDDGHFPGGGGGGGAAGQRGGGGAAGMVTIVWGDWTGITRFSSGCCCGHCDLLKGDMPQTIDLAFTKTEEIEPDNFDPSPITTEIDQDIAFGCDGTDIRNIHYGPETYDQAAIDERRSNFVSGKSIQLELTEFHGDATSSETLAPPKVPDILNVGERPIYFNYCKAVYQPPIDGSLDAMVWGHQRWSAIGTDPLPSFDTPKTTWAIPAEGNTCERYEYYTWTRRGTVRGTTTLTIILFHRQSDGKYAWSKAIDDLIFYEDCSSGFWQSPDDYGGSESPASPDGSERCVFMNVGFFGGVAYGVDAYIESSVTYDTAQEAMDAAAITPFVDVEFSAIWSEDSFDGTIFTSGPWYETVTAEPCTPLPNGFFICGITDYTYEFAPSGGVDRWDFANFTIDTNW